MEQGIEPKKFADIPLVQALVASLRGVFDGVLLLGSRYQVLFANFPAATALGCTSEDALIGRSLEEVGRMGSIPSWAKRVLEAEEEDHLEDEVPVEKSGSEPRVLDLRFCRNVGPGLHLMAIRDATERRRRERGQATYVAVAEVLLESPSLSEALPKLLKALASPLGWSVAEIFRVDSEPSRLRWEGDWHLTDSPRVTDICRRHVFSRGEGLPGQAWARSAPIWIEDLSQDAGLPCRKRLEDAGLKSTLAFPVRARGEIVGVLLFFSEHRRARDEGVLRLLSALDALIGQFLERMRLLEAERAQQEKRELIARKLRTLQQMTINLMSAFTSAQVAQVVLSAGVDTFGADSASLFLLDDSGQELELHGAIAYPYAPDSAPVHFAIDAREPISECTRTGEAIFICSFDELAARYPKRAESLRVPRDSWVILPLVAEGRASGAIGLTFVDRKEFDEGERALMRTLADQCALALDRARLYEVERTAKEQAEAERARFHTILMNAPIPVVVYEEPGHVIAVTNPAWIQMITNLGGEVEGLVGRPLRQAWSAPFSEAAEYVARELDRVCETGEAHALSEFAVPIPKTDGSIDMRYYAASAQPVRDDAGRVRTIVQMAVDITEQVAARRQKEAAYDEATAEMRAKDEFLAILSHELRTPLQSMLGWTQLLLSRPFEPQLTRRGIETLERNTKQQAKLIEQLLEVSRVIAGKILLDRQPLGLKSVVEATLDSLRTEAAKKGVEVVTVCDEDCHVSGDADRLRQVLTNLVGNAIKFTPPGGLVTISLAREKDKARLSVADTGKGIPPILLRHIFEPFRQADASSRRMHGGLGLGLSIVKHLVEHHGGTVYAESPGENQGATFTLELPILVTKDRAHAVGSVDDSPENPVPLPQARVLVVDDDVDASEVTAMALRDAGAQVQIACSAREAVERFWEMRPDLLISDIGMPEEDGYALLRKLRNIDDSLGTHTPAIALTAYASDSDRHRALDAGFNAHLAKPIPPATLVRLVAALLNAEPERS